MRKASVAFFLAVIISLSCVQAFAQSQNRIVNTIDEHNSVRIAHSRHPLASTRNDLGRVESELRMDRMLLLLRPSPEQEKALQALIASQNDPASANYHQWLSPEQYSARFGPTPSDLGKIKGWLAHQGFTITSVASGGQWIEFSGKAAQVESTFQTQIHRFNVHGEKHVANASEISIPQALAPVVRGLVALNDFRMRPMHRNATPVQRNSLTGMLEPVKSNTSTDPEFTSPHGHHYLAPGDWARIYNTSPLLQQNINGSGVSIAVVGADSDIQLSDVRTFRKIFNLPAKDPQIIINGTYPGTYYPAEVEASLDVEWAGAVAPQADIKLVTSASTYSTNGFFLSLAYIVDHRVAPIMSVSIGGCELFFGNEGNAFMNSVYRQAAAEGITVLSASGDTGEAGCDPQVSDSPAYWGPAVNASASTPYNVAVGGTQFNENGQNDLYWNSSDRHADLSSVNGYIPEAVWNESCDPNVDPDACFGTYMYSLDAGSGGASNCVDSTFNPDYTFTCDAGYPKPQWQYAPGVPDDGVRDVPDISFTGAGAHDGYLICIEGSCQTSVVNGQTVLEHAYVVGGTSAGAPSMAGVMALLEQSKGKFLGLINPRLYRLASAQNAADCDSSAMLDPQQSTPCVFRDITSGNNTVPGQPGADAAPGYDLATGLGSINVAQLVTRWESVGKRGTMTAFSVGKAPSYKHGQPVPISVAVKPANGAGTPSGDFSLVASNGGSALGGSLDHGVFQSTVSNLPGGKYSVSAHYGGDQDFLPSDSAPVKITVTPEDTAITVQAIDMNIFYGGITFPEPVDGSVIYGQPVGLQIAVHGASGIGAPSGNIYVLMDGSTKLGPYALNEAGNVFVWLDHTGQHGLQPGNHTFVVSYAGDASFQSSTSAPTPLLVRKSGLRYRLTPVPFQVDYTAGQPITITLTFGTFEGDLHGTDQPTGTVQLRDCMQYSDDRQCLQSKLVTPVIQLSNHGPLGEGRAQAQFQITLPEGQHAIGVNYSGDANYEAISGDDSSPFEASLNVIPPPSLNTTVTETQSAAAIDIGQSVTYSVAVRSAHKGDPAPTGTVTWIDLDSNPLADPVALVNGIASVNIPWNTAGAQEVLAIFSGDANYNTNYSAPVTTLVRQAKASISLAAASSSATAQAPTSFTVLVFGNAGPNVASPGAENGVVEFWDSSNGLPAQLLQSRTLTVNDGGISTTVLPVTLPIGVHRITAKFLGTSDWTPAVSNQVTVNVNNSPVSGQ